MIMKLEMPLIDPSLRGGKVVRWNFAEGDSFGFGDELCVVAVDEFAVLRRTARATLLSGKKRKELKSDLEVRGGKVFVQVSLTSSDSGVLAAIVAGEGDPVVTGSLLAVTSTHDHGPVEGDVEDWKKASGLRVVANMVPEDDHIDDLEGGD